MNITRTKKFFLFFVIFIGVAFVSKISFAQSNLGPIYNQGGDHWATVYISPTSIVRGSIQSVTISGEFQAPILEAECRGEQSYYYAGSYNLYNVREVTYAVYNSQGTQVSPDYQLSQFSQYNVASGGIDAPCEYPLTQEDRATNPLPRAPRIFNIVSGAVRIPGDFISTLSAGDYRIIFEGRASSDRVNYDDSHTSDYNCSGGCSDIQFVANIAGSDNVSFTITPPSGGPTVYGCTNPSSPNYNPNATVDNGSCGNPPVPGCTNPSATNYNSNATQDDGSCTNTPPPPPPGCNISIDDFSADSSDISSGSGTTLRFTLSGSAVWSISLLSGNTTPSPSAGSGSSGTISTGNLNQTHVYRLTACGGSIYRDVTVVTTSPPGSAPGGFSISGSCYAWPNTQGDIGLNTTSSGAENYELQRKINNSGWVTVLEVAAGGISSVNHTEAVAANSTYYWRVIATNSNPNITVSNITSYAVNSTNCGGSSPPPPQTCTDPTATNYGGALPCTYTVVSASCIDNAAVSFVNAIPDTLTPGQVVSFKIRSVDTGNTKWYHGSYYRLIQTTSSPTISIVSTGANVGPYPYYNVNGVNYGHLPDIIYPGDQLDWTFNLTAPNTLGTYEFDMKMWRGAGADFIQPDGTTCPGPSDEGYFGTDASKTFTVVNAVPTVSYQCGSPLSSSCTTTYGGTVPISWTSTGATSCFIGGASVPLNSTSGYTSSPLYSSTSSTLSCVNSGGSTSQTSISVTVSSAPTYSLTVSANPGPGGSIESFDDKINCGPTCSATYNQSSTVVLNAVPASSYWKFTGWAGDCTGTGQCTLIINSNKTVTAGFGPRVFNYEEF